MHTDKNENRLICRNETKQIIGCAIEVTNTLGHGLLEKPYENALRVEFGSGRIPYEQQPRFPVDYKGVRVGEFVPDLVVFGRVIVDTKVVERLSDSEIGQMMNYLRVTKLRVGLLLNFAHPRLQWKRVVL